MSKILTLVIVAALLFAACSKTELHQVVLTNGLPKGDLVQLSIGNDEVGYSLLEARGQEVDSLLVAEGYWRFYALITTCGTIVAVQGDVLVDRDRECLVLDVGLLWQ